MNSPFKSAQLELKCEETENRKCSVTRANLTIFLPNMKLEEGRGETDKGERVGERRRRRRGKGGVGGGGRRVLGVYEISPMGLGNNESP